jgi:hypothetical protein
MLFFNLPDVEYRFNIKLVSFQKVKKNTGKQ